MLLETARTISRPITLADASEAFAWFGDPEVMRYIPMGHDASIADTEARIGRYMKHQESYGFGKCVIADRATGELIGDAGLYQLPENMGIELGYRIRRSHWGQGLATEVAMGWIEAAPEFIADSTLYAFALPENAASLHIIRKLGFAYLRDETVYGKRAPLYSISLSVPNNEA